MNLEPIVLPAAAAARRSEELRTGTTPSLRHRRRVAALATASTAVMGLLGLYQVGVVRRLPEVPHRPFDANRVDASAQAYQVLGLPDAAVGALSYSVTLVLAGAGGATPARWQAGLLAAKASIDAAYAAKLASDQVTKHRAACSWCLATTAMTMATLVESLRALREAGR